MKEQPGYEEMAACAKREVKYRRRVYARMVETGTLEPDKAQREIELMEAIAEYFEGLSQPQFL